MSAVSQNKLKENTLRLFDVIIMAIAGTAPAYTLAATTGVIVAAVGLASPAAILYAAIPMVGVAWSFSQLNKCDTDAGASYSWVGGSISPVMGFLAGWALLVAATLFMVAGTLPAGTATLDLLAPQYVDNTAIVTLIGAFWFLLMNYLVLRGITITVRAQWIMTIAEVLLLLVFGIAGLFKFHGALAANHFSLAWIFSIKQFSISTFAAGAVIAAFFYWGWDVTANLSEETESTKKVTGIGTMVGMVILIAIFIMFVVMAQMGLSVKELSEADNIFPALGQKIFGGKLGDLLVLALILSTVATLETTLIQVTRTLFSMGRDKVIPQVFSSIHERWGTPWAASLLITTLGIIFFVLSNFISSVGDILTIAINAISLQVIFYYGLACISMAIIYKNYAKRSFKDMFLYKIWPLFSAIYLIVLGIYDLPQLGLTTDFVGIGLILVGLIPAYIAKRKGVEFFTKNTIDISEMEHLKLSK